MGIPARSFRGRAGYGRACLAIRGEKGAEIPPLVLCYAAGAAGVRGKTPPSVRDAFTNSRSGACRPIRVSSSGMGAANREAGSSPVPRYISIRAVASGSSIGVSVVRRGEDLPAALRDGLSCGGVCVIEQYVALPSEKIRPCLAFRQILNRLLGGASPSPTGHFPAFRASRDAVMIRSHSSAEKDVPGWRFDRF